MIIAVDWDTKHQTKQTNKSFHNAAPNNDQPMDIYTSHIYPKQYSNSCMLGNFSSKFTFFEKFFHDHHLSGKQIAGHPVGPDPGTNYLQIQ